MDRLAIRAFISRDWQGAARAKAEYWARLFRDDPRAVWDAAQALLAHARTLRPDFPTGEERDADLRAHLSLRSLLDRAAHAFSRR